MSRDLRAAIVFSVHDLVADAPFSRLDLISCRNLLIYLRPEVQQKVLSLFHFRLARRRRPVSRPLGNREQRRDHFEPISNKQRIYQAYRPQPARRSGASPRPWRGRAVAVAPAARGRRRATARHLAILRSACCSRAYAPASVLVNRKHQAAVFLWSDRPLSENAGRSPRAWTCWPRRGGAAPRDQGGARCRRARDCKRQSPSPAG